MTLMKRINWCVRKFQAPFPKLDALCYLILEALLLWIPPLKEVLTVIGNFIFILIMYILLYRYWCKFLNIY